jgi:hypothetical protein
MSALDLKASLNELRRLYSVCFRFVVFHSTVLSQEELYVKSCLSYYENFL